MFTKMLYPNTTTKAFMLKSIMIHLKANHRAELLPKSPSITPTAS